MLRSRPLIAVISVALLTGCSSMSFGDLRGVDWPAVAGRDLNCTGKVMQVGDAFLHDISGDGRAEAFVTMRCVVEGERQPEPGQLEVFAGDSSRANPRRIAVLVRNSEGIILDGCIIVAGTRVIAPGARNDETIFRSVRAQGAGWRTENVPALDAADYSCT